MKELKVVVLFTQWAIKNEKSAILGKSYILIIDILWCHPLRGRGDLPKGDITP